MEGDGGWVRGRGGQYHPCPIPIGDFSSLGIPLPDTHFAPKSLPIRVGDPLETRPRGNFCHP
ncbi:unnamed protein product [Prunus armeniaca]